MKRSRTKRNASEGSAPNSSDVVRATEIGVVTQIQEQIESAMKAGSVSRDQLAGSLKLTRAMVDHILESPDAGLHDLSAIAAVLGLSFQVKGYPSGS